MSTEGNLGKPNYGNPDVGLTLYSAAMGAHRRFKGRVEGDDH